MVTSCAYSLWACGRRIWSSEFLRPLFMLAEKPNGIDDVGWSGVFDVFFQWWLAVPIHFARASVVFEVLKFSPRSPMALAMLADVKFSIFCCSMMTSCAYSLCACRRRIWSSELSRPLFMLSESRAALWNWRCWLKLSFWFLIVQWWPAVPIRFARADVVFEVLNFWSHCSCSVSAEKPNGIDDVGWTWVFDLLFFNDDQLCLFTLCVRASYLKFWIFKTTFHAQWKPRRLTALTMLAEVKFSFFFVFQWWPAVLVHFARAGVIFEVLNL